MDHRTTCQDVMRCEMCETAVVQMHCETCRVNLCKPCIGEHISADLAKPHKIVDFRKRKSSLIYPKCTSHDEEICEMHCNNCDIPVCSNCLVTGKHLGHTFVKVLQFRKDKLDKIIKVETELKEIIYPINEDIASDVQNRMSQLEEEYGDLSTAITKHGEDWHRKIDQLVEKLKAEVEEMKITQLETLERHLNEIHEKMSNIMEMMKATTQRQQ
ncbi:E3 ubiquitin-protein ligase TRIM45-like [Saccostrea echinata]|uniref:E3 ubiquitin-protein ligase TRIM45-like n=1 Tax=Saccostrea echinata TaxID=191078 RepID=UPI002A83547E|nr:E3 ubiquitin-protein ligase TRIM45-like [Saccostrea echinata]